MSDNISEDKMIKDIMAKNSGVLPNSYEKEKLRQTFPQYFDRDGNFDFESFKTNLENVGLGFTNESFGLNFLGKQYGRLQAGLDTKTVITPDLEHNNKPENKNSENIYIKGDNIDALRHLLKSYAGKIKCIYIDPPYNTGSDGFAYPDNFEFTLDDFLKMGMSLEDAERVLKLKGKSSHSAWLTFMYPRLLLARDLLSDDGVMFISIDENEVENLLEMCNTSVFGQNNSDSLIWQKMDARYDRNTNAKIINRTKSVHETILICYKDKNNTFFGKIKKLPEWKNEQSNPDNDPRGKYKQGIISFKEGHENEDRNSIYYYSIKAPSGRIYTRHFFITKEEYIKLENDNRIYYPNNGDGVPALKVFENEEQEYKCESILRGFGTSSSAKDEIEKIFRNREIFDTPKPEKLIKELLRMTTSKDSIILDFFSGSATSAHACMQLNAEDGGSRKYIMVQIPEKLKEDSEGYKAGYRTICDIGIERIKRASKKIKEETGAEVDYGFKIYELNNVSDETIDKCESFDKASNLFIPENYVDYFKFGNVGGVETILTTWKVRDGFGFNAEYSEVVFGEYKAYRIDKYLYLINTNIKPYIKQLLEYLDKNDIGSVILFGYSFNLEELQEIKVNIKNTFDKDSGKEIFVEERY